MLNSIMGFSDKSVRKDLPMKYAKLIISLYCDDLFPLHYLSFNFKDIISKNEYFIYHIALS